MDPAVSLLPKRTSHRGGYAPMGGSLPCPGHASRARGGPSQREIRYRRGRAVPGDPPIEREFYSGGYDRIGGRPSELSPTLPPLARIFSGPQLHQVLRGLQQGRSQGRGQCNRPQFLLPASVASHLRGSAVLYDWWRDYSFLPHSGNVDRL